MADQTRRAATDPSDLDPVIADLVARVERLEAENRALRRELAAPRPSAGAAPSDPPAEGPEPPRRLSRRGVLLGVAGATAAVVAHGAEPAAATNGQPILAGAVNSASQPTFLIGTTAGSTDTMLRVTDTGSHDALHGEAISGRGVVGESSSNNGVHGLSTSWNGVLGHSGALSGLGAFGGVVGDSSERNGVAGLSGSANGVFGASAGRSSFNAVAGVLGDSSVRYGVAGFSTSNAGMRAASSSGSGIYASSTSGIGAVVSGGRAPLQLTPKSTPGRPTSGTHGKGELVVDSAGSLFICTATGTPGTWKKVTVTSA